MCLRALDEKLSDPPERIDGARGGGGGGGIGWTRDQKVSMLIRRLATS